MSKAAIGQIKCKFKMGLCIGGFSSNIILEWKSKAMVVMRIYLKTKEDFSSFLQKSEHEEKSKEKK